MRRKTFSITAALALFAASFGCAGRRTEDRVTQGVHGPSSPAESGEHGADAFNRPPYGENQAMMDAEHQTAGLNGELTNGKVDPTMEGSGNLAWQGSYEREKRLKMQAEAQAPPKAPEQKPVVRRTETP
jgi:hypothetical protein